MISNVPDFRLSMGGADLRGTLFNELTKLLDIIQKVVPRLVSMTLTEKRGDEADQLDLVLTDAVSLNAARLAIPNPGVTLNLQIGWKQGSDVTVGLVDKGTFIVDEVSHDGMPDIITIRAHSADFTGKLTTRKDKGWHATTLGGIVAEIAGHHGLKPSCEASLASIAFDAKAQSGESDIAFLKRLGREHDAVATIKRGTLVFAPIGTGQTPSGKALPVVTIKRADGGNHSFKISKREATEGVTAAWHDRGAAKRKTVTVGKEGGSKKLLKVHGNEKDARTAAQAAMGRSQRSQCSLDLTLAVGRPELFPEQKVKVEGYTAEIDAVPWLIDEVSHSYSNSGFVTSIKLQGLEK